MTKRQRPDTSIGTPMGKQEKFTPQPPSEGFQKLFKPIFQAEKIRAGDQTLLLEEEENPLFQALIRGYHQLENPPTPEERELAHKQKELADFVIAHSMKEHPYGKVNYIKLLPQKRSSTLAGAYDPDNGVIELYPQSQRANPILSLIHEGTHALDDKLMRTHQGPALDYLASQESAFKPVKWPPKKEFDPLPILWGAQKIIPDKSFYMGYSSEPSHDIKEAYKILDTKTFSGARAALESIRKKGSVPNNGPFYSFSEFPAHAMEHLYRPWSINYETNRQSAEFMHDILGDVQKHFQNLGLTQADHPNIMQGFQERLRQLQEAIRRPTAGAAAAAGGAAAAAPAGMSPVPAPAAAGGAAAAAAAGMSPAPAPAAAAAAAGPATTIGTPAGGGRFFIPPE